MALNLIIGIIYCAVSVLCALVLISNARFLSIVTARYSVTRNLFLSYVFAALSSLFGCTYSLMELNVISFGTAFSFLPTLISEIGSALHILFWVCYSEQKQESRNSRTDKRFALFLMPFFAVLILMLSTPFTRWYFYFDGGHFHRGPLFYPIAGIIMAYLCITGVSALSRSSQKENYINRIEFRRLFFYAFWLFIIWLIQLLLPAEYFPYRSFGTMLIFGILINQTMVDMIGVDALSRLNNRYTMERFLADQMNSGKPFGLAMLDIDKFKSINDTYGHPEGDNAIKYVAKAILESVPKHYCVARSGGDEFVIIGGKSEDDFVQMEYKINSNLNAILMEKQCEYHFTVSLGYIIKDSTVDNIPDLIERADKQLYERKTRKKDFLKEFT